MLSRLPTDHPIRLIYERLDDLQTALYQAYQAAEATCYSLGFEPPAEPEADHDENP